jgi:cysteine desulfurase / selenocysteine lyase
MTDLYAPGPEPKSQTPRFDVARVRRDFPAIDQRVHDKPLVYLDSAASALKPQPVIDAVTRFYTRDSANVHRGVHQLSQRATDAFEGARESVRAFLNARQPQEIVFLRGVTEAINLLAQTYGRSRLSAGDEIVITELEHHSNIVPWQILAEQTGVKLVVAPITDAGEVEVSALAAKIGPRTRIVSVVHASNALGTVLPIKEIARLAHEHGAILVVDGAQGAPHLTVDVQDLDCDFYALSGHKLYGPTGIGALYGRREIFETLPPYHGGGSMIRSVTFERTTYAGLPERYEAGTPHVSGAIGLGAAVEYVRSLDRRGLEAHEADVLQHGTRLLEGIPGVRLIGTAKKKIGVLSFVVDGIHPHDLGTIVDTEGVAIRTGHHCTQPLMQRMGVPATARASLGMYSTREDLDALARAIEKAQRMFA